MAREESLGEQFVGQVSRRVLNLIDLFEDDVPLPHDLRFREDGMQQEIAQQIDGVRQVLVEGQDVVTGALVRRVRIEIAADAVDFLRELLRRAGGRPLEQHVLDEVRDAGLGGILVTRSARQPDPQADGSDGRHRVDEKAEPARQDESRDRSVGPVGSGYRRRRHR